MVTWQVLRISTKCVYIRVYVYVCIARKVKEKDRGEGVSTTPQGYLRRLVCMLYNNKIYNYI